MGIVLTKEEVIAFCRACNWAHETWSVHRGFQDNLPADGELRRKHGYFLNRLSLMTQEYVLLQVCKLHDPAVQGRNVNISIDLIVKTGRWDDNRLAELQRMASELGKLYLHLAPARRKVLAHNDRDVAVAEQAMGDFPSGMDQEYFVTLQTFVDLVHDSVVGGPFPFSSFARVDTALFVEDIQQLRNEISDDSD
jgi:hypothetical protein